MKKFLFLIIIISAFAAGVYYGHEYLGFDFFIDGKVNLSNNKKLLH